MMEYVKLILSNPLYQTKYLVLTKLATFADNEFIVAKMISSFFFYKAKNIKGKEGNAGYQHFHLFPQCFHKPSLSGS